MVGQNRELLGQNTAQVFHYEEHGEVAERLNAPVLKTGVVAIPPWVRIPPSPPSTSHLQPISGAGHEDVEHWHQKNADQKSREQTADNDQGKWPLGIRADSG